MTAIEMIKAQQAEARMKAKADFLLMADAIAKDEPAPADALRILADSGRTAEQLEQAVAVARERIALEPKAAAFEQILTDRAKAQEEMKAATEKANAELRAAHEKAEAVLAPMRKKAADLAEAEAQSRYARQRLRTLADGAKPSAEYAGPITSNVMDGVRTAPRVTTTDEG